LCPNLKKPIMNPNLFSIFAELDEILFLDVLLCRRIFKKRLLVAL
jgi:hypothetical protein